MRRVGRQEGAAPLASGVALGPAVWLSGYAILPLAKVYNTDREYEARTLADDLSAHLGYGIAASTVFRGPDPGEIMTSTTVPSDMGQQQDLIGQTLVVIGGSSGIGLETARLARAHGAEVVLTARDPKRLRDAAEQVGAESTAAFDATDLDRLEQFFDGLPGPIDHVLVTGSGPYYSTLADMDFARAGRDVEQRILTTLAVARFGAARMRPAGTLLFIGGTGGRSTGAGRTLISAMTAALPPLIANLALELAPVRANLIAAGFVDTPLSASLLGDQLDARRAELRATLPIGRVVGPADIAALAVHLMTNTAVTGATYDIDGGQQLLGI